MADGDPGPFGVSPDGTMPGGGVLRYPAQTPGARRAPVSWYDDLWNNAVTAAGTFGTDPNSIGPNGVPMPKAVPTPGSPTQPIGTTIHNTQQSPAASVGADPDALSAAFVGGPQVHMPTQVAKPVNPAVMKVVNSPIDFTKTPGLGYGGSANTDPNKPIAYTPPQPSVIPPNATAQAPQNTPMPPPRPGAPQAPPQQQQPYGSPWDPQGAGYAAAQRLAQQQSPWDPQGVALAASQRLAQRAPVQGPMAAFGPQASSPFTMVMRPNADPTNSRGGTPLATALDLSGYQPPPPPAPPSYNLGYGGGGRGPAPAPRPFRAQAPASPYVYPRTNAPLPSKDINAVPLNKSYNPFQLFGTPT